MDASGAPGWAARMQAGRPIMWLGFMTVPGGWWGAAGRLSGAVPQLAGAGADTTRDHPQNSPREKSQKSGAVLYSLLAEAASLSPRSVSDVKRPDSGLGSLLAFGRGTQRCRASVQVWRGMAASGIPRPAATPSRGARAINVPLADRGEYAAQAVIVVIVTPALSLDVSVDRAIGAPRRTPATDPLFAS